MFCFISFCRYKLVTVEFPYFGLQGKVETLIQSYQKSLFGASHRQLFCWIDEWFGKTMADIRAMERETKALLDAKVMLFLWFKSFIHSLHFLKHAADCGFVPASSERKSMRI
jgi:hypothetical protein